MTERQIALLTSRLVQEAKYFAMGAHAGQKRKYTGEPYFYHLQEVATRVASIPLATQEMVAAAFLHDTVEDTPCTTDDINWTFGGTVANLVYWLTDQSKPADGNRNARKTVDRAHIAQAHPDAMSIKLADLISNTKSIVQYDKGFAPVYLNEKRLLLEVLKYGDAIIYEEAKNLLNESLANLSLMQVGAYLVRTGSTT